jgi:hypothetical protein
MLEPVTGTVSTMDAPAETWREAAGPLVNAALAFDGAASRTFAGAGSDPTQQAFAAVRDALGRLSARIAPMERSWR